jgi:secretion/DNA translocation related CpaE-like protein
VRPLVVTADPRLLDDLLRLAAAADVDVEVAADAAAARASWLRAPVVVVGPDVAHDVGRTLPRRPTGVVLVGLDLDDAGVWECGVEVAAQHVVFLPDAQDWLVGRLADAGADGSGGGPVVAVVGGRGGAGATTLAAALAVTALRAGLAPCLVDGDPLGGGIDLVLGGEDTAGLRWPDLVSSRGRVSASTLRSALPSYEQELVVLSWDRGDLLSVPPLAMRAVLASARRGAGLVVVDLPRRVDEAATEVLSVADLVLLVVPAEVRATAAAARVAAGLAAVAGDIRLVVRGPGPGGLAAPAVGDALGLEVLGTYRSEPAVTAAAERGEPPARSGRGPLAEVCRVVLAELGLTGRAAA